MSVSITSNANGDTLTLAITGRFDFNAHGDFVGAYEDKTGFANYVVDMGQTEYLDSSALGMLLLLKDHAEANSAKVSLSHVNDEVRKILDIANFGQIFSIS